MPRLTPEQLDLLLAETVNSFPHQECLTCECFLGLVARLSIDAGAAAAPRLAPYKVPRAQIHACLGCDPCPPGNQYARYTRSGPQLISL